jgi:hypothetical protein
VGSLSASNCTAELGKLTASLSYTVLASIVTDFKTRINVARTLYPVVFSLNPGEFAKIIVNNNVWTSAEGEWHLLLYKIGTKLRPHTLLHNWLIIVTRLLSIRRGVQTQQRQIFVFTAFSPALGPI